MLVIAILAFLMYCAHIPEVWWYVFLGAGALDAVRLTVLALKTPKVVVKPPLSETSTNVPRARDEELTLQPHESSTTNL